jgi:SAM-dependent methyltransferase
MGETMQNVERRSMRERWEEAHADARFRPAYPHEQVVRWTFRTLDRRAASTTKVLDLGCGAGRHAVFFAHQGFDVHACDISATGIAYLQSLTERLGITIQTHQTPGHDLSHYGDKSFDAVLCFGVMYYMSIDQAGQMIREVYRILKTGGKFLCVTRNDGDGRRQHAIFLGRCTWHITALAAEVASHVETGMDMLFFSKSDIEEIFRGRFDVCIDRMTYLHHDFADDDWVISATKIEV